MATSDTIRQGLKTKPHCVDSLFCHSVKPSERIVDGQDIEPVRVIKGYRQGDRGLLVDRDLREFGCESPCEDTTVSYRQRRCPGIEREGHSLGTNGNVSCPEYGWDDHPMLIGYRELM